MGIKPPTTGDLERIAGYFGLKLDQSELAMFGELVTGSLASYGEVERLWAERAPQAPAGRTFERPAPENNKLGAWYVTTSLATGATGPLSGKRLAVKDNICVGGIPMQNGSPAVEGFVPKQDASVVARVLDAGATVTGKSVCEHLCYSGGSHTSATGPVRNPWNLARTTGGSSSGSAALLASGEVDLALGGDQGGSIRIPAAFSGIVGHKPTYGLVPCTGAFPIENTLDHLGPMARSVSDAALLLNVLAGRDGHDYRQPKTLPTTDYLAGIDGGVAGLSIGVVEEGFALPGLSQPEVDAAVRAAIGVLEEAGAKASPVSVPWHRDGFHVWAVIAFEGGYWQMIESNGFGFNHPGTYDPEAVAHLGRGRREKVNELSDTLKFAMLSARYTLETAYGQHYAMAQNLAPVVRAAYDEALADHDVLVMPTLPIVASELPDESTPRAEAIGRTLGMLPNTAVTDVTGHPATSVPAGLVDGLPVGMMIIGRHFADETCLRVARAYEQAVGGFPMPPGY